MARLRPKPALQFKARDGSGAAIASLPLALPADQVPKQAA
jgi:hypothetical protein